MARDQEHYLARPDQGPGPKQCCFIGHAGPRCSNPARFWVGPDDHSGYVLVCSWHLDLAQARGDIIYQLPGD